MTTDQLATEDPVWGAPDPSPRRWGVRETAVAVGVAAVIAGLGGAAIYAATEGNSHSMGGGAHQPFGGGPGGPGGQHSGQMGASGPEPISLHGEFVVPDGSGGYTTELTQTGTVTAISPSAISVRSEDGFSQTYAIPQAASNAQAPVAIDDQVTVRAIRTGQTATVSTIGPAGGPHRN
jgi:hypothetical protein